MTAIDVADTKFATPVLSLHLQYVARHALDCDAYWTADQHYRRNGFAYKPYSDDEVTAAGVRQLLRLHDRVERIFRERHSVTYVAFTRDELDAVEDAVGLIFGKAENPQKHEDRRRADISKKDVEALLRALTVSAERLQFKLCDACSKARWGTKVPLPGLELSDDGLIRGCPECRLYFNDTAAHRALEAFLLTHWLGEDAILPSQSIQAQLANPEPLQELRAWFGWNESIRVYWHPEANNSEGAWLETTTKQQLEPTRVYAWTKGEATNAEG